MMFTVERNTLLKSLQKVVGVIEQRQTMPILANILLTIEGRQLSLISTDLEIELMDKILLEDVNFSGSITIPGRKLLDICKVLPEDSILSFLRGEDTSRIVVRFGSSRFVLSSLCADEYPKIDWDKEANSTKISIKQEDLLKLLRATQFAMEYAVKPRSSGGGYKALLTKSLTGCFLLLYILPKNLNRSSVA